MLVDSNETPNEDSNDLLPFDISIQYHILRMMAESEHFLVLCNTYLKPSYFENSVLGWFFDTTTKHYATYKNKIELVTIKNEILKFDARDRSRYEIVFDKIQQSDYKDEAYLRHELNRWVKSRQFIHLHTTVAELYNKNKKEEAYDFTTEAISQLQQINFNEDKVIQFDQVEDLISRVSNTTENRIPMGIPQIDEAMLGGLLKGTLTTVLGSTNTGKTVTLINFAYNAIKAGKKVLFIYHEGHNDQMTLRCLSRFTEIPYSRFYIGYNNLTDQEKEKIVLNKKIIHDNLILKPWQTFGTTVEEVISYCKQKKNDFDFDQIIVDYGQLLYIKSPTKELRHNQASVYRALGSLASELNVSVVTAAQGNRDSHSKAEKGERLLGLTDISECFEIVRCSEAVITLTRSSVDLVNNKVKIMLAKQRDGRTNVAVDCNSDISRLIVYDKSIGIYPLNLTSSAEIVKNENPEQLRPVS